jgi:hypothetical protein
MSTKIKDRLWLGQDTLTGNPAYVNVLYADDNYTNKVIAVFTTEQGELWEVAYAPP